MSLRVALAQIDARVGDVDGNVQRFLEAWYAAAGQGADLVVGTELTITGYPPEDLLLKPEFVAANLRGLERLTTEGPAGCTAIVGFVGTGDAGHGGRLRSDVAVATRDLTNAAAVLRDGEVIATYDKLRLPNYGVFDEARYFVPVDRPCLVEVAGVTVGVTICEDLWSEDGPVRTAATAGAEVIANLNASPYHRHKAVERLDWLRSHARGHGVTLLYCNVVGGQDEVVFDGDSLIVDPRGEVVARGAQFHEDVVVADLAPAGGNRTDDERPPIRWRQTARLDELGEVWHALTRATRDYCHRNGFREALVGVSGGIDSAVVAALAADALGAAQVTTVAMPSPYSSAGSLTDAEALARALGTPYHVLDIGAPLTAVGEMLGDLVVTGFDRGDGQRPGVAYENLQSRLRGLSLMALSNETGAIVLTTGNKSEYAVGYATLYGDMSGGFAPIKDIPKLLVYELARWRNREREVIPTATIEKPPSAELRPGQLDQDSLPDYAVLDDLVTGYVEEDLGIGDLVARGHDEAEVRRVVQLIDRAEYKRRQAAPGPKITGRAFGRDRRVPITNGWRG